MLDIYKKQMQFGFFNLEIIYIHLFSGKPWTYHSLMNLTEPIPFFHIILVDLAPPSILLTMQIYLLALATRLWHVQCTKIAAWYTLMMSTCFFNEHIAFFKEKRK